MAKSGPRTTNRYSHEFKAAAVRLSEFPDALIQDVTDALDIHPFMLSRWRKQAQEGLIATKGVKIDTETTAELKRVQPADLPPVAESGRNRRQEPDCHPSVHRANRLEKETEKTIVERTKL